MKFPFFTESPTRAQRLGILLASTLIIGLCLYLQRQPEVPSSLPPQWPQWDTALLLVDVKTLLPDSFKLAPFAFDPNTVSDTALRHMGLRHKVIKTWMNYRQKGGRFYKPEQVKRLYALHDTEYSQLAPFIRIAKTAPQWTPHSIKPIALNEADTSQLSTLPGIGSKRAQAIVQYREALGGYIEKAQLLEISIIDSATYLRIIPYITIQKKNIRTINLNEVTWSEFKAHPYFKGALGHEILNWRKSKNYQIDKLDDLTELKAVDGEIFRKIVPYLSLKKP